VDWALEVTGLLEVLVDQEVGVETVVRVEREIPQA
jgi:hypothetical protein